MLSGRALALAVLAWSLLKVCVARLFGQKTGLALFHENYDADRRKLTDIANDYKAKWLSAVGASKLVDLLGLEEFRDYDPAFTQDAMRSDRVPFRFDVEEETGNLVVTGNFRFDGVVIVLGDFEAGAGTADIYGAVIMGPDAGEVRATGTFQLRYSEEAIRFTNALTGRYVTFNGWQELAAR